MNIYDFNTFIVPAAALAAFTMLVSKSDAFSWVRSWCADWTPIHCPVCLSFWVCSPAMLDATTFSQGFMQYLALVTFSNLFMFGIAKLYLAIDDMDYTPE